MEQLDDIYIPIESIWLNLLQPGWIGLAMLCIAGTIIALMLLKNAAIRRERRRFITYIKHQNQLSANEANAILKAYISTRKSEDVAYLHSRQWRSFLLAHCDMRGYMEPLNYLSGEYYRKHTDTIDKSTLKEMVLHWVQHHTKL